MTALPTESPIPSGMTRIMTGAGIGLPTYIYDMSKLSAESQSAAGRAAELRQRIDACTNPTQVLKTYKGVVDLMKPVTFGTPEIPPDATRMMFSNKRFDVKNTLIGESKIEKLRTIGNYLYFEQINGKSIHVEIVPGVNEASGDDLQLTVNYLHESQVLMVNKINIPPPSPEKDEAIALLKGLTGYMVDGLATSSSLTSIRGEDVNPSPEKQKAYAKNLETGFSKLRDKLPPIGEVVQVIPEAEKKIETLSVAEAVLKGLKLELDSQEKPKIAQNFIDFVTKYNLQPQMDSLLKELTNMSKIYEYTDYSQFGSAIEASIIDKIIEEIGLPKGTKQIPNETIPKFRELRSKVLPMFEALKGSMIMVNLAGRIDLNQNGNSYATWADKLGISTYFEKLMTQIYPEAKTEEKPAKRYLVIMNAIKNSGELLSDAEEYKILKQRISSI